MTFHTFMILIILAVVDFTASFQREHFSINLRPFFRNRILLSNNPSDIDIDNGRTNPSINSFDSRNLFPKMSSYISVVFEILSIEPTAIEIIKLCDKIDSSNDLTETYLLKYSRSVLLTNILKRNRSEYIDIVQFVGSRIPRVELPNLQDVEVQQFEKPESSPDVLADCKLPNITFSESPLDTVLLSIFRSLVQKEVGWKSEVAGIKGLLEEGFMLYFPLFKCRFFDFIIHITTAHTKRPLLQVDTFC